ncbi:replicative DNA helicase [Streptomyces sp. NPDC048507]|uniref:replicative DNA helicase n=1 Tax=Streptomyces sp. NPDC048507 TaxID=3365560 RepID=UPI00371D2CDA
MPGEDAVPAGPHRQMLTSLHTAYAAAGRPGLRAISLGLKGDDYAPTTLNYQAIGKILNGLTLPNPRQLVSLAGWLYREGESGGSGDGAEGFTRDLVELREAAHKRQLGVADTEPSSRETDHHPSERHVLSCIMQSRDALADVVEILNRDDFADHLCADIYEVIQGLCNKGLEVSVENVCGELARDGAGAADVLDYLKIIESAKIDPTEAEVLAEGIVSRAVLRRVGALGTEVADRAREISGSDAPDVDDLIRLIDDRLYSIVGQREARISEVLEQALDEVEGVDFDFGTPTGFRDYDLLHRGLRPGQVVIVGGASGMGKSTLGLNFIRSCSFASSQPSFLVSLQMSREEALMRMMSAEARVAVHHMRSGTMTDDDWTRIARVAPAFSDAPIYIVDEPGYTLGELMDACKRMRTYKGVRLVVIDSLDLLYVEPSKGVGDQEKDLSVAIRELRRMAKELDLAVVCLYQMGRLPGGGYIPRPELHHIPACLEALADVVILLHREDAYERESPRAGEADLFIAKNRTGPTGAITAAFQGHYARFVDMSGT